MHAGNTTGAGITFISVSQPTASPAGVISFIGINVDTSVPGNTYPFKITYRYGCFEIIWQRYVIEWQCC